MSHDWDDYTQGFPRSRQNDFARTLLWGIGLFVVAAFVALWWLTR